MERKKVLKTVLVVAIVVCLLCAVIYAAVRNKGGRETETVVGVTEEVAPETETDKAEETESETQTESEPEAEPETTGTDNNASGEKTYAFSDMIIDDQAAEVTVEQIENGETKLIFDGQYKSVFLQIPEEVDSAALQKITFRITSDRANDLGYKAYTQEDYADKYNKETVVSYENPMIETMGAEMKYVALMSLREGVTEVTISDITFLSQAGGGRSVQKDIPDLYEVLSDDGGITYTGVAIPITALRDSARMELVTKHFNSVTCENEMKPESILGSNAPGVKTVEELEKKLNFASADTVADWITDYNAANGTNIRMRGHVFVWHSQTPTWFFREDFTKDGDFVTKEVMNQRMEWYIKTVAEHFDQKHPGLIYAWDVVNEQAADSGGIRTDGDWYNVYKGSDEYIVNAFRYADQYVAQDTILFYNDYNECTPSKCDTIVRFLEKIRKEISSDRKLGAGMQGHHDMATPSASTIEAAARAYADVADVVHITELDLKSTVGFDGTDLETEFTKGAYRYKEIYDIVKKVNADDTLKGSIDNITFWGTHDAASWLKTSNSVGGSADGKTPQYPLLFDDDLQAKPAFWAFVDADELKPLAQKTVAVQSDDYTNANSYSYDAGGAEVTVRPIWDESGVRFEIAVKDNTVGDDDTLTLYADTANAKGESSSIVIETVKASEAEWTATGYRTEVQIPVELAVGQTIAFDVILQKNDTKYAFNDKTFQQETSSEYYAEMEMKPFLIVQQGTAQIDGDASEWKDVPAVSLEVKSSDEMEASAEAKVMWDAQNLYVLVEVTDPNLDKDSEQDHEQDSVEIFIDELNEKAGAYDNNDKQYRINYENAQSFNGETCTAENIDSKATVTDNGYMIEAAIKWTTLRPTAGRLIGIDLQINDAKNGTRIGTANWYDASGNGWSNPGVYGTAALN